MVVGCSAGLVAFGKSVKSCKLTFRIIYQLSKQIQEKEENKVLVWEENKKRQDSKTQQQNSPYINPIYLPASPNHFTFTHQKSPATTTN